MLRVTASTPVVSVVTSLMVSIDMFLTPGEANEKMLYIRIGLL